MTPHLRVPARRLFVGVWCAAALLAAAGCGRGDGAEDGSSELPSDDVVTLHLDVASTDQDQIRDTTQVVQRRLDAIGVERSDIGWDGSTIEVLVPGGDEQLLRASLRGPARLELRPVLAVLGEVPTGDDLVVAQDRVAALRDQLDVPDGVTAAQIVADEQAAEAAARTGDGAGDGAADGSGGEAATEALNQWGVDVYVPEFAELFELEGRLAATPTPVADQRPDGSITSLGPDGTAYLVGPVAIDGRAVLGATAARGSGGDWSVNPVLDDGADGIDAFNTVAAQCYEGADACPGTVGEHGQIAIVVDGAVISAPSINTSSFVADQITISGSFDETDARALAAALDAGVAPVAWTLRD